MKSLKTTKLKAGIVSVGDEVEIVFVEDKAGIVSGLKNLFPVDLFSLNVGILEGFESCEGFDNVLSRTS